VFSLISLSSAREYKSQKKRSRRHWIWTRNNAKGLGLPLLIRKGEKKRREKVKK